MRYLGRLYRGQSSRSEGEMVRSRRRAARLGAGLARRRLALALAAAAACLASSCSSEPDHEGDKAGASDVVADGGADGAADGGLADAAGAVADALDFEFKTGDLNLPDFAGNEAPVVVWVKPQVGDLIQLGDKAGFEAVLSDDATDPTQLTVEVTLTGLPAPKNLALQPGEDGKLSFEIDDLPAGVQTLTLSVRDGMLAVTESSVSILVNSPPGAPKVLIEPAIPTTDDDLVAKITSHAVDVDRALAYDKAYTWTWKRDGKVVEGLKGADVPADQTAPGQTWQVLVYANDGSADGPEAIAWTQITNRAPTSPVISLQPPNPTVASTVKCVLDAPSKDPDGDELTYGYAWTLGGLPLPEAGTADSVQLAQAATPLYQALVMVKAGDVLGCTVQASDGAAASLPAQVTVALAAFDGCAAQPQACHADAACTPTATLAVGCACKKGFAGDGQSCVDIDECDGGGGKCPDNQTCANTPGAFECLCNAGWKPDGDKCVDVDECADKTAKCDPNASCVNEEGGYACACKAGYEGDGKTCEDVDECDGVVQACGLGAECSNTVGSFECTCTAGFASKGDTCEDIDECQTGEAVCDLAAECTNTIGGYTCACKKGYVGNGKQCQDVDECLSGKAGCDPHAKCTNAPGDFACKCDAGWQGDGLKCEDVDECKTGAAKCDENASCTNTPGAWGCKCKPGFTGDGATCVDIDECKTGAFACDAQAACVNMDGSYICKCGQGYVGDGKICEDVDECANGAAKCHEAAICGNTAGGYTCKCKPGWTGDGKSCKPEQPS